MKSKSANPHHPTTAAVQGQTALWPLLWLAMTLSCLAIGAKAQQVPALLHTYAVRGCTQEDAPALEIYFTRTAYSGINDPTPPYLRFEISAAPTETFTNLTLELLPLRLDAARKPSRIARAEWVANEQNSAFLTGTITLTLAARRAATGGQLQGHYQITTPNGQTLTKTFHTPYPAKTAVCG